MSKLYKQNTTGVVYVPVDSIPIYRSIYTRISVPVQLYLKATGRNGERFSTIPASRFQRRSQTAVQSSNHAQGAPSTAAGAGALAGPTPPAGLGQEPGTPCRPATRTNKHAPQKSVCGRGPTGSAQRCAGVRKRGLAEPGRETVKRFPKGKHLTNPADPRGAGQLSMQPSQRCDQSY